MGNTDDEHRSGKKLDSYLHDSKVQILALAIAAFLLSIKADGSFPFSEQIPEPLYQLIILPFSIVFFSAIIIFIWPGLISGMNAQVKRILRPSLLKLAVIVSILFEAITLTVLLIENYRLKTLGYDLNIPLVCVLFACIFIIFILFLLKKDLSPIELFIAAIVAFAGTYLMSIAYFPLNPARSDMLPLIVDASKNFIAGNSPYATYLINSNLLHLTYLPSLWMAFLPAAFFSFDPRLINLACIILAAVLIYHCADYKEKAAAMLAIFLLCPYLQYRHDIYLGVIWLYFAVLYYGVQKRNHIISTVSIALGATAYQLVWVVVPFYFAYLLNKCGKKVLALSAMTFIGVCTIIVLPFIMWAPDVFIQGTIGHWTGQRYVLAANLSYMIAYLIGWNFIRYLQVALLSILFLLVIKRIASGSDLFKWAAVALTLFIALNTFIDAYFYLITLLLLIMYTLSGDKKSKTV